MDSTYYEAGFVEEGFLGSLKSGEGDLNSSAQLTVGAVVHPGDYFVYDYIEDGYFEPKLRLVEGSALLAAETSLAAAGGYLLTSSADLRAEFGFNIGARELNTDIFVWLVPAESRYYTVAKETRHVTVHSENKTWRVV